MNRTPPRRVRAPALILALCAAVLLGMTGASAATAASTESSQVTFTGTAYLADANETVDIVGNVHLVTRLTGTEQTGWTLDWQTNLDNVTGFGLITGTRYVGSGADNGTVTLPPGPPTRSATLQATFTLLPPGPPTHPPSPIRLAAHVSYDETGQVSDVGIHIEQAFATVD
jgi:hypothetical protein